MHVRAWEPAEPLCVLVTARLAQRSPSRSRDVIVGVAGHTSQNMSKDRNAVCRKLPPCLCTFFWATDSFLADLFCLPCTHAFAIRKSINGNGIHGLGTEELLLKTQGQCFCWETQGEAAGHTQLCCSTTALESQTYQKM